MPVQLHHIERLKGIEMTRVITEEQLLRNPQRYYKCQVCHVIRQAGGTSTKPQTVCRKCKGAPKSSAHGTLTSYTHGKCRCALCREAMAEYRKGTRSRYADKYTHTCLNPECSKEFRSDKPNRDYCSNRCSAIGVARASRVQRTLPVLYDPIFAGHQQQRVASGKYLTPDRHWIDYKRRYALYELHNWTCQECGVRCSWASLDDGVEAITLDHLLPRTKWPEGHPLMHDDFNLTVLCRPCNSRKLNHVTNKAWIPYLVLSGDLSVNKARQLRREMIKKSPREEEPNGRI